MNNREAYTPLTYWLSEEGDVVLRRTQEFLRTTNNDTLRATVLLRKATSCSPDMASDALEIALCRQKASVFGEWTRGGLFTRQSLEQATSPVIAKHHAERFRGCSHVLEICSGAGFDTAALAQAAERVTTIEADERLAEMARHNLSQQGITNVEVECGFAEEVCKRLDMNAFDGLWSDPSRRDMNGRRIQSPDEYAPSLRWLQSIEIQGVGGVKIAPGVNCEAHHLAGDWQREWVGFENECREQVLWRGLEKGVLRDGTATLCSSDGKFNQWKPPEKFSANLSANLSTAALWNGDETLLAGKFLLEPHGALIRTGHLATFFAEQEWMLFDEQIAYGIAVDKPSQSPWYRRFEIIEALPFHYGRLKERLLAYGWGNGTEIKKRGFPEMPEEVRKKLKLPSGGEAGVVVCTRKGNRHWAILARRSGD